jgi:tetratricopeptide (TPR) repeat protein
LIFDMVDSSASLPQNHPVGDVYDWYVRGLALLDDGHPAAASQLLARAHAEEPQARNILEALARARLATGQYAQARDDFEQLVLRQPDDDYARLGLGLALARLGEFELAVEQLALAVAMRPDRTDYEKQLRQVRATLRARQSS